jgi:DNA-binding SARP family transcriptional activator
VWGVLLRSHGVSSTPCGVQSADGITRYQLTGRGDLKKEDFVAQYTVELFGKVRIMEGEAVRLEQFRTRRSALLLAYLAYHAGAFVSRQALGALLWEDANEKTQRDRLRYEISLLKRTLAQSEIVSLGGAKIGIETQGKDFVRLSGDFVCDAYLFEIGGKEALSIEATSSRLDTLEKTIALYKDDFLTNYYEYWILEKRNYLHQLYQMFLRQMIKDMDAEGRIEKLYWERLLEI